MTTPQLHSEEKPRSVIGSFLCTAIAAILFPILFVLGWVTASPIYVKREAVELFVSLRDDSYRLLTGRTFKAMILNNPASGSDSKK